MYTNPDDQTLSRLRADFPGHRIWRSTRYDGLPGDWVATLRDTWAGVDPTVIRDSAADLRQALDAERERRTR
ncbi:hypothetical protein ACGFNU_31475 [Spirillospora sp. NPDC048911]|uniref:hypothetical protein n=1 Tax=Spirillospora sp. NPDC048911 TaxID=3364527 RepID=UPI00371CA4AB